MMLHQTLKFVLYHQKRLTYCSLQAVLRQCRTLHSDGFGCNNRLFQRRCCLKSEFINSSSKSFCGSVQKHTINESDKICSGDLDETGHKSHPDFTEFEGNLNKAKVGETDGIKESIDLSRRKLEPPLENVSDIEGDGFSDADNEDIKTDLVKYKGNNVTQLKEGPDRSLAPSDMFYRPKSIVQSFMEEEEICTREDLKSERDELEEQHCLELAEKGEIQVEGVEKVAIPQLHNVAPIVNDSEVLTKMVQLGVDLSVVQKKGMIEHVMKMNFKKDVGTYIWFLKDSGVPSDKIGEVITKCPWVFQHDVQNLRVRIDYLRSKKFSGEQISNMLDKDPKFLLIPVERIDAKLGFLQQEFQLTGNQLRQKVGGLSKLIIAKPFIIKENKFYIKKMLGFTEHELKTMFLTYPKIFLKDVDRVASRFNYLHNVMELPHKLIAKTPQALNKPYLKLDSRHRFLVKCGRAQYDPTKPNYVSLEALITEIDETWCVEVAEASVAEFNRFLRLI